MIALDTNVLVRFLVEDDPAQSARAAKLIERAVARNEALFVSDLVLCETVSELLSAYRVPRAEVAALLAQVLKASHLAFRDAEALALVSGSAPTRPSRSCSCSGTTISPGWGQLLQRPLAHQAVATAAASMIPTATYLSLARACPRGM